MNKFSSISDFNKVNYDYLNYQLNNFYKFDQKKLRDNYHSKINFISKKKFPIKNGYSTIYIESLHNLKSEFIIRNLKLENVDMNNIKTIKILYGYYDHILDTISTEIIPQLSEILNIQNDMSIPFYTMYVGLNYPKNSLLTIKIETKNKNKINSGFCTADIYKSQNEFKNGITNKGGILTYLTYSTILRKISKVSNNILMVNAIVYYIILITNNNYNSWLQIDITNNNSLKLYSESKNSFCIYKISDLNHRSDIHNGLNLNNKKIKISLDPSFDHGPNINYNLYFIYSNSMFYALKNSKMAGNLNNTK